MKNRAGQTLVLLLVFMVVVVTLTSAAVVVMAVNSRAAADVEQAMQAHALAEAGVENALLLLLRDPGFAGGIVDVAGGQATVTVTGNSPVTVDAVGQAGNFRRHVRVMAEYTNYVLTVTSWMEIWD